MSEQAGHWETPDVNYVDPERRFCAFCGRPIARRFWQQATAEGDEAAFCTPEHAARHTTYATKSMTKTDDQEPVAKPGGCEEFGAWE